MRIVHAVRSGSFGGVERYLTYVAPEQVARGHEVVVIGGDPAFMAGHLDAAGVVHRPAASTADVAKALLALRRFRPDVVHSHMTAADSASLATRLLVRGARISTLHFAKPRGRSGLLRAAWRVADRSFAGQIATSAFVARRARTRSSVIWSGLPDLDDATCVAVDRVGDRQRVVLVAQRFEAEKDTALAVRAWAGCGGPELGWELHLAGRGQEQGRLEALVAELGVGASVRFLGMVDDLPDRMAVASVFVAPSPNEAFGLSVAEAMRAGLPVVAVDSGAHPEVLGRSSAPDVTLVEVGQVEPLRDALRRLLHDPDLRRTLGAANAERFRAEFTADRHVDRVDEFYAARVAHRPRPRSVQARRGGREAAARVVFVDHCAQMSGGEIALVRLIEGFDDVRAHVVLGEHGPLEASLRHAGASVEVQELDPRLATTRRDEVGLSIGLHRLTSTVRTVGQLRRRLRQLGPDAVHTNSLKAAIYGGIAGRLAGIPVVWHIRDRIADDYLPGPVVVAVRVLARVLPSAVICNSEETRSTIGLPVGGRTPVTVVHDPVPELASIAATRAPDAVPFRVAIVGRLSPWKGQDVFLRALATAFPDGDVEAAVIGSAMFGDDAWEADLRRLVDELGLADRVRFSGFVDDVPGALAEVDVLVHASTIPEPFGQVVVEGMALGLPVVASAAGGPLEIITDGVDGLLSPPGDVDALAERLTRLRADPGLRRRLGEAGRARVASLTPASVARVVADVYDQVR